MMRFYSATIAVVGLIVSVPANGQDRRAVRLAVAPTTQVNSGALSDAIIANVPFSADAVTTVTQTLGDGTKIEQRTTSKWYRDSTGRVRREQTVIGLDRLNPSAPPQTAITFDSVPGDPMPYTLNPSARTARRAPRGVQWLPARLYAPLGFTVGRAINAEKAAASGLENRWTVETYFRERAGLQSQPVPPGLNPTEEALGSRQIEGVKATGRRSTTIIPAGRIGNDRPIQIVEEQWESPELNMVVSSRFSDPRTGVVEYRLTNINRSEPRADLFAVPSDYTVIDPGAAYRDALSGATPQPGGRSATPGQRGGGRGN